MKPNNDIALEGKMMRVPIAVEIVTGERPSPSKCWRWYMKGIQGIRLQTWLVGGKRLTTLAAVREWIQERTQQAAEEHVPSDGPVKPRQLDAATRERLEKELGVTL